MTRSYFEVQYVRFAGSARNMTGRPDLVAIGFEAQGERLGRSHMLP